MKMSILDDVVLAVSKWNANAGNIPASADNDVSRETQLFEQLKLVVEELQELYDAIEADDDVEIIDAVCDINVVAAYAAVLMNTPIVKDDSGFKYDCNDTGFDTIHFSSHGFPESFKDDDVKLVIVFNSISYLTNVVSDVPTFKAYFYSSTFDRIREVVEGIGQYLYLVGERVYGKRVMEESMAEVLSTNDAKFMTIESAHEKLEQTIESYRGRYDNIKVVETPLGMACFRCNDGNGKILKPWDWVAPDIQSIMNKSE